MVSMAMKKLKFRRKKKSEYAFEQDRDDVEKNERSGEEKRSISMQKASFLLMNQVQI